MEKQRTSFPVFDDEEFCNPPRARGDGPARKQITETYASNYTCYTMPLNPIQFSHGGADSSEDAMQQWHPWSLYSHLQRSYEKVLLRSIKR